MSPGVLGNIAEPLPVVSVAEELIHSKRTDPYSLFMYNDIAVLSSRFFAAW